MSELRKLRKTKISTEMRFGYLGHIRPWQGLQDDYRTYCGVISFSTEEDSRNV